MQKIIEAGVKKLSSRPCAVCGGIAEAVASFTPEDTAAFGAGPDDAIYIPVCKKCLETFDPDFMEAHLLHGGVQISPEQTN